MLNRTKRSILLAGVLIVILSVCIITAIFIRYSAKEKHIEKTVKKVLPKIAIVLDDWGYNKRYLNLLDSINAPITISVLPKVVYSRYIAERESCLSNREVILHMPMEPENSSVQLEEMTLLTTMSKADAKHMLKIAFNSTPKAKGISNHMGSKATRDIGLMLVVLEYVKHENIYFLDSYSSDKSICEDAANSLGVNFVKRDIFLDNILEKDYIRDQFNKLVDTAKEKGSAIGIGHNHELTLEVIKERVDDLNGSEIEFVLASELIKKQ